LFIASLAKHSSSKIKAKEQAQKSNSMANVTTFSSTANVTAFSMFNLAPSYFQLVLQVALNWPYLNEIPHLLYSLESNEQFNSVFKRASQ
jgi:hypothetical protein